MSNLRQELEDLLQQKRLNKVGFHHTYQINQLLQKAKRARKLRNLIITPFFRWKQVLADSQFVIETLEAN
ncbi:hypothetical protein [Leptothoe spongobia]|uniref:Uncharacterized protein n=1 Tax=Leptothoe spongobia TAU-MAC 1115 TaxID=1967444 RepID=A0A947DF40_9CYAN|nr:hypothetical protein [Leptothoe spongobia]MBT9315615.1 hypothetical protein [Leptothoe spongobia TAU-MAC 1115]